MSVRGNKVTLLAAGTTPATVATSLTAFTAYGNSCTLYIATLVGGAGTCTLSLISSHDGTNYYTVMDLDSAVSWTVDVNTAGNYELKIAGGLIPGNKYIVKYACDVAAGTIGIDAVLWENPAGDIDFNVGDIHQDIASISVSSDVNLIEVLGTAHSVTNPVFAELTDGTAVIAPTNALSVGPGAIGAGYDSGVDASFVVGDSPATIDLNAALSRNANQGYFANDGAGDISIKISEDGTPTLGDAIIIKNGEVFSLDGLNVDQIQVTHVADSAYRWFAK